MHNRHGWNEKTEEGEKRLLEATKFGRTWTIRSKVGRDGCWVTHDPPDLRDLENLRDILENKYKRRRASYEDVKSVEELIRLRKLL